MARPKFKTHDGALTPTPKTGYRVAPGKLCYHKGVEYKPGDILPDLTVDQLNVHLPCIELVELELENCPVPVPVPEPAPEIEVDESVPYDADFE